MEQSITNCGLIALRKVDELKNISIRTLINLAEDNGVKLYSYKIPLDKFNSIPLPAIFHADNHFEYITNLEQLKNFELSGFVLTTTETEYPKVSELFTASITGQTWVAAGIASGAATMSAVEYFVAQDEAKKARDNAPKYEIPKGYLENKRLAEQIKAAGLPDTVYNNWENSINKGLSYNLANQADLKSGTIGLAGATNTANLGYAGLNAADAQAKMKGAELLSAANTDVGNQEAIQYQLNVLDPAARYNAANAANTGALLQNLNSAGMMAGSAFAGSGGGGGAKQTPYYYGKDMGVTGTSPNNPNAIGYSPYIKNDFSMVNPEGTFGNPYGNQSNPTTANGSGTSYADLYWRDKMLTGNGQ